MREHAFSYVKNSFQGDAKMCVSKEKIALMLSKVSVINEFFPDSPWNNESKVWKSFSYTYHTSDVTNLKLRFTHVISSIINKYDTIAVAFSGGLDSLAILLETSRQCKDLGKTCIAITAEMVDDKGESCFLQSQKVIKDFSIDCKHIKFVPKNSSTLYWNKEGPRREAMPYAVQEMANIAESQNAKVILSGSGADSILGCPKYLTYTFLEQKKYTDLFYYVVDVGKAGFWALRREFSSLFSNKLEPYLSVKAYMALSDPEVCDVEVNNHLNEPYKTLVNSWSKDWLINNIDLLIKHHSSWAKMDAINLINMYDPLPPAGEILHINPFEDDELVRISTEIPLEIRYNSSFPSAYLRQKSLVVSLIGIDNLKYLPQYKKTYRNTIMGSSVKDLCNPDTLIKSGILQKNFESFFDKDDVYGNNMLARIAMLDTWLMNTLNMGYKLI